MLSFLMKSYFLLILALCATTNVSLNALPAQVIIIRHAEKPANGNSLSTKGRERAAALAPYFMETKELLTYGTPVAIYAMASSKDHPSKRPIETVTPLSEQLKIPLKTAYARNEYKKMAEEIKNAPEYAGNTVLVCWEHDVIPEMARAFGALQTPAKWQSDIFDRNWIITFSNTGRASFLNMPQQLLFGDTQN